jgi:hypothetical protein
MRDILAHLKGKLLGKQEAAREAEARRKRAEEEVTMINKKIREVEEE